MTPHLTAGLPGIGGQLKAQPEDFFVEEIPLYQPAGTGEHTYLVIEKRGLSTYAAVRAIAQALNVSPKNIGYAGLKDTRAVTRQMISVQGVSPEAVKRLDLPKLKILEVTRHHNKLKIGHLAGNRFVIRVRQVTQAALAPAENIIERLKAIGVPNFFGEQRFGNRTNTHYLGEMIVRQNAAEFVAEYLGRPQPDEFEALQIARRLVDNQQWDEALVKWPPQLRDERRVLAAIARAGGDNTIAFRVLDRKLTNLFVAAFQAHLFNQLLTERLPRLGRLEQGDVAYIHTKGAAFIVDNPAEEQARADTFEISPAGPLFGPKLLMAEGEPGRRERELLTNYGLAVDDFKAPGLKIRGLRRPYRFELKQVKVWWDEGLMVSFELPPGAYATTVMAEIMKTQSHTYGTWLTDTF